MLHTVAFTWRAGVVALVAVVAVAGCKSSDHTRWSRYHSADGLFSVEFPGKPVVSSKTRLTGLAVTKIHTIKLERGSAGIVQLTHYQMVQESKDVKDARLMNIECNAPHKESSFRARKPKPRALAGRPGVVITATAPRSSSLPNGGFEQEGCVIVGMRMYHLIAVGPDDAATRKAATRFLSSFQVQAAGK